MNSVKQKSHHYFSDIAKENNARGLFDISSAIMLMKSPEFAEIIVSTGRLYNVDLDQLKTKDDKVSFFGNLQNLMFIHMCMFIVDDVMKRKVNFFSILFKRSLIRKDSSLFLFPFFFISNLFVIQFHFSI